MSGSKSIYRDALSSPEPGEREYITWQFRRYKETWATVQQYIMPPAKILEVGTLMGHIAIGLSNLGYEVETVDLPEVIAKYGAQLTRHGIPAVTCNLNYQDLPFPDNQFSAIVFTEILEHLDPLSLQHVISEICRVLQVGGYLFLSTPNLFDIGNRCRILIGHLPLAQDHIREYSLQEIHSILKGENIFTLSGRISLSNPKIETDLEIIDEWYSLVIDRMFVGKYKYIKILLYPFKIIYPRFRNTIFIVARKKP